MIFVKQLDSDLKKGVFSPQSFALSCIWRSSYKAKQIMWLHIPKWEIWYTSNKYIVYII